MRKPLPTLAAAAVILAACSAGGTDTMAELMRDAGAMLEDAARALDSSGPSEAAAQVKDPEVLEADCDKEWTMETGGGSATSSISRSSYHVFPATDFKRIRSAWLCQPRMPVAGCVSGTTCKGEQPPATNCYQTVPAIADNGVVVTCGTQTTLTISGNAPVVTETRYAKARLVLN